MIAVSTRTVVPQPSHAAPSPSVFRASRPWQGTDRFEETIRGRQIFEEGGIVGPRGSPTPVQRMPFMNNRVFASFEDFAKVVAENDGQLLLHPGMSFKLFVPTGRVLRGHDDANSPFEVSELNWPAPTKGPSGTWYEVKAKDDARESATDELGFGSGCFPTDPEFSFTLQVAAFLR